MKAAQAFVASERKVWVCDLPQTFFVSAFARWEKIWPFDIEIYNLSPLVSNINILKKEFMNNLCCFTILESNLPMFQILSSLPTLRGVQCLAISERSD